MKEANIIYTHIHTYAHTQHFWCSSFLLVNLNYSLLSFPSILRNCFNISCSIDLLVTNYLISKCLYFTFLYFFKGFLFLRLYLFMRERERERERDRDRDTGRGRSRLHAGSLMWDLIQGLQNQALD